MVFQENFRNPEIDDSDSGNEQPDFGPYLDSPCPKPIAETNETAKPADNNNTKAADKTNPELLSKLGPVLKEFIESAETMKFLSDLVGKVESIRIGKYIDKKNQPWLSVTMENKKGFRLDLNPNNDTEEAADQTDGEETGDKKNLVEQLNIGKKMSFYIRPVLGDKPEDKPAIQLAGVSGISFSRKSKDSGDGQPETESGEEEIAKPSIETKPSSLQISEDGISMRARTHLNAINRVMREKIYSLSAKELAGDKDGLFTSLISDPEMMKQFAQTLNDILSSENFTGAELNQGSDGDPNIKLSLKEGATLKIIPGAPINLSDSPQATLFGPTKSMGLQNIDGVSVNMPFVGTRNLESASLAKDDKENLVLSIQLTDPAHPENKLKPVVIPIMEADK